MYRAQAGARAADGVASHGSLDAYIHDFHACSKAFEMFVADRLSVDGHRFLLWEDLDAATKEARGLTKADAGVDVTDGATTLVQCKLRARYLTWRECATFFASAVSFTDGAYHVPWQSLILARNACCKLSRTLAELGASRPFDVPVELSEFRAYAQECLAEQAVQVQAVQAAQAAQAAEPRNHQAQTQTQELRDYQVEAIALCAKETTAPAYVVLPTGCGKSLVMALVAAGSGGSSRCLVLVFVPLVVLLEQFLEVLLANGCEALAVGGGHEYTADEVSAARVVVCVYNSAHKVDATTFKIVLIDEAHCVRRPAIYSDLDDDSVESVESVEPVEPVEYDESAGSMDSANEDDADSASEHDASSVEAGSPRSARGAGYAAVRAASRHPNARLLSATQDVPEGAESCERTLRWTIDAGYLCDYTLDVPVFDVGAGNADLARFIVRNYRSIIVFCSTHAQGTAFCAAMNEHGPCARYIDCDTGRRERNDVLAAFKSGNLAFVVNVRVLAMGFDAPITKGVCFVSMPASKTHIVQVIGRCLRLHPDKRIAHVILPLVAGHEDEDKRVRDFMRVLAQNDTRFAHALRAGGGGYVSVRRVESDTSIASVADEEGADLAGAAEALYTAVYDSMGVAVDGADRWSARFDELVAFYEANGRFPPAHGPGGLGGWLNNQRTGRATMGAERKARLEALEWWTWNQLDDAWSTKFEELVAYHAEHGTLAPKSAPGGLGAWVGNQRRRGARMDAERKARLDALDWWVWKVNEAPVVVGWDARFDELVAYHAQHGTFPLFATPGGLGQWLNSQRNRRATMDSERKARLEALEWWTWNTLDAAWSTQFDELVSYHAEHGTLPAYATPLGAWVGAQRHSRETITPERKARLETLPWWVWSLRATPVRPGWDARFDELVAYHAEHGTLPAYATPGLGAWVANQRHARPTMPTERKARLEALAWWVWDARDDAWCTKFDELVAHHAEHGRSPPQSTPGGLGHWVDSQRQARSTMPTERKARLEALAWWVWDTRDDAWSTKFDETVAYHAEHGTLPAYATPGLGTWVASQRTDRETMDAERKVRLEALGWWVWDPLDDAWSTKFGQVVAYHAEHSTLPAHGTPLRTWVGWQRKGRATMATERKARLDALEWWVWDPLDDAWSTQFDALVSYHAEHGTLPPRSAPGCLGAWVHTQRQCRARMSVERKSRLDALEWWVWDTLDDAWNTQFDELVAFYEANGRIPPQSTPGGLGTWAITQRQRRATMSAERKAKLDSLGWWAWSVRAAPMLVGWDARFDELVAYHAEHGRLPPSAEAGGLGQWVDNQRQARTTMNGERKARLEALEWWVWNPFDDAWNTQFDQVVAYHAANGILPPFAEPSGLGRWVDRQRSARDTMDAERQERLGALAWWVWSSLDHAWSTKFDELVAYHAEHGTLAPRSAPRGLGNWAKMQRSKRETMSAERKARLQGLEWWAWSALVSV
jgi:hypothetical protein